MFGDLKILEHKYQLIYENQKNLNQKVSTLERIDYWINHKNYKMVNFVSLRELSRYAEVDRNDSRNRFTDIDKLADDLRENGIKEPLILGVNKLTKRALLTDGNHRLVAAKKAGMELVPVVIEPVFTPDKLWGKKTNIHVKGNSLYNRTAKEFGFTAYTPKELLQMFNRYQQKTTINS